MKTVKPEELVRCILCRGLVSINIRIRFEEHMNQEHRVYFETDLLLEACKLNSVNTEDLKVIKSIIQGMFDENIKLMNNDVNDSITDIRDSTLNNSSSLQELDDDILKGNNIDFEENLLQAEDFNAGIPSHLLDEFQKLCDVPKPNSAKKSTRKGNYLKQEPVEIKKRLKTFDCNKCSKSFGLSVKLKKHMQTKHSPPTPIVSTVTKKKSNDCPYCKKTFKFEIMLKRHVQYKCKKKSMNEDKQEYACDFCDESYVSFGNLHRHKKWAHRNSMSDKTLGMKSPFKFDTKRANAKANSLAKVKSTIFK